MVCGEKFQVDNDPLREKMWGEVDRESSESTLKATDGGAVVGGGG